MSVRQSLLGGVVFFSLLYATSSAYAVIIAEFDFGQPPIGESVPNQGVGPDGVLFGNASVADGLLNLENTSLTSEDDPHGMDLPLGALNPFGGDSDWRIAFDFSSEDSGGPLFSSDSGACPDDCNDAEQRGSINIFLDGGGAVVADAWFIGAMATGGGFDDGETHSVELTYTADESLWEFFVDEDPVAENSWEYARDASGDRTRVGGLSNPDFGFEIDAGMDALAVTIDNFVIEAPSPPPVILTVNRDTGELALESIVEELNFNEIAIGSDSGSLDGATWKSIAGNYDGTGDSSVSGSNWSIESQVAELLGENGNGGKLVSDQKVDLGAGVWLRSPLEDISVNIFDSDQGELVRGAVNYVGDPALLGDLNLDGELSGLDWELFVEGFGQELEGLSGRDAYFLADLNVDGLHDEEDFIEFVEVFDAANGAGAFAAMAAAVPEPAGITILGLGAIGLLSLRRRRIFQRRLTVSKSVPVLLAALFTVLFVAAESARAELLAEYTFDSDTSDSSGNGRDGELDEGIDIGLGAGNPEVTGGQLKLTGAFLEGMIIPLNDANPFDGSNSFTIDMSFTATEHEDGAGHLLISSADFNLPTEGDNHSMALFIEPEGDIVYDNFFVGEVRVTPPANVIDDEKHDIRLTYSAPAVPDDPGTMFIRVDGTWLGADEIAPDVPGIANHEVRLGSSLNEDFPFECAGSECFVREFKGTLDDVRIYDESFLPTEISAEVNRANGDIKVTGGEFARDVKYYELSSAAGALNSVAWAGGNLDSQNLDAAGDASGQTWDSLTGSTNRLVEAFLLGSTLFDNGKEVTLPGTWAGGDEDLELKIVTTDQEVLGVDITYVGEGNGNPGGGCDPDTLGDIDGSGDVGFSDFLILSVNFNQAAADHTTGDINCSGSVDFADFLVLSSNFNTTVEVASSVPEPSSWVMLWMATLLALAARRRAK